MNDYLNFAIEGKKPVSAAFQERGVTDFHGAIEYMKELPYARNADKANLLTVFNDGCGTCSTKHALLKQLADEHNITEVHLILAVVKMSKDTLPELTDILTSYNLEYIPEAHNYLMVGDVVVDCTKSTWTNNQFSSDLMLVTEIQPGQITDYKVNMHKAFLKQWLADNTHIPYALDELFAIREECIKGLS